MYNIGGMLQQVRHSGPRRVDARVHGHSSTSEEGLLSYKYMIHETRLYGRTHAQIAARHSYNALTTLIYCFQEIVVL